MKKMIVYLLLLAFICPTYAQTKNQHDPLIQEGYLKKSKNQKKAAWGLLGGGALIFTVGSALAFQNPLSSNSSDAVMPVFGLGMAVGSIPLFISSGKNKRRAATLGLQTQPLLLPQQRGMGFSHPPALTVRIGL